MIAPLIKSQTDSEELLLQHLLQGDERAMHTLYAQYIRYFTAICSRYIHDDEDVRDVLQDTFLKIFASIGTFQYRGPGSLKGWMTRILMNESLKFLQQQQRMKFVDLNEQMNIPDGDPPDTSDIPPSVIHAMIRELPDGYRTIFNLYVIEGKSHKEISTLLGIKENTSASQLSRAKALLADKIRKYKTNYTSTP